MLINEIAGKISSASILERSLVVKQSIVQLKEAHPDDLPSQLADAQQIEKRITISNAAEWWRNRAVPALLQDKSSFADTSLIIAATHPASAIASPWSAGETWVTPWVKQCLLVNKPFLRGFLDSFANEEPVADHPLILRVARNFLLELFAHPEGQAKALAFAQWAEPRSLATPNKAMTAGDLIIVLAEQRKVVVNADGTLGTDGDPESEQWQKLIKRILNGIVEKSEQGEHIPESWQNQSERIAELLDACPPWQREGVRRLHIQRRAQNRLREALQGLNTETKDAIKVFPNISDMDKVDRAVRDIETRVRFSTPFWQPGSNTPLRTHIKQLNENSRRIRTELSEQDSDSRIAQVRGAAENVFQKQQDFINRGRSPIVRTEVFRAMAPHGILSSGTILHFMQKQATELSASHLLETLTDPENWQAQTQRRIIGGSESMHTKAWRVLEAWDGQRGRALGDDSSGTKTAAALYEQLPGWLTGSDPLPPNTDAPHDDGADLWQDIRSLLGAVTLLGTPPAADGTPNQLHERLREILGSLVQNSALYSLLAAAHIDLSLSRMASGEDSLAHALGLLDPGSANINTERLKSLVDWSASALNSPFSWESRAGMNGLIFLVRLAETTGNIFVANLLPTIFASSVRASQLITGALHRLRTQAKSGEHSDLPLAFVAFDLARASREAAEGIRPQPAEQLAAKHPWLQHFNDSEQINFTPELMIQDLVGKLGDNTNITESFLTDTRLAGRTLLLSLFEARLAAFQQKQRLRINALQKGDADLIALERIRNTARRLFCTDRILLADVDRLNRLKESFAPWWKIGYWNNEQTAGSSPPERSTEGFVSWLPAFNNEPEARLLAWAADLESAVPVPQPNSDRDIDGRSEYALPKFTWGRAWNDLEKAELDLKAAEENYKTALTTDIESAQQQEFVRLMRQPLELNIADFQEQTNAAIAEVRAAEANLEGAKHRSLAAELETIAAGFIYDAAEYETQRRMLLEEVTEKEKEVTELDTEIAAIQQRIADGEVSAAEMETELRQNMIKSARINLEMAQNTYKAVNKRIALMRNLLQDEHDYKGTKVFGKIGLMGAQISDSLTTKLAADLIDAKKDQAKEEKKERRRKKLERQNRLVKSALRFIGAAVGFVCGGPAGASLGAEIGGAIAELREGVLANKPPEDILLGLVDNGIAIAEASGLDLKGELNALGKKGAEKVTAFFAEMESELGPIFETMPTLLDEQVVKDALIVLGVDDDIPDFMERIEKTYTAFKKDASELGNLGDVLFGGNGGTALDFKDPKALRDHLKNNLFGDTLEEHTELKKVAEKIGSDLKKLETPEGREEAKERLANLIVTKVSQEAVQYRDEIVRKWSLPKLKDGKLWKDETVQKEAKPLLEALYPNEKDRKELEKGLNRMLGGKELLQAQVETQLAPWQGELDRRISEISKACNEKIAQNPPKSAVAAARARVKYIEEFQNRFGIPDANPGTLADWLQGNSQERNKLFVELDKLENKATESLNELEKSKLALDNAGIELQQAEVALKNAQDAVKIAGVERVKAELEVEQATLMVRVSKLSGIKAGKEKEAEKASVEARKAEQDAATEAVNVAEANLIAARERAKGAEQRRSVSRRIRTSLRLPVFSFSSAGAAAFAREEHAEALDKAFRTIRELLRHVRAAGINVNAERELELGYSKLIQTNGARNSWGKVIEKYRETVEEKVIMDQMFAPKAGKLHIQITESKLREQHIELLFGKGLTLFFGPKGTNEQYGRIEQLVKDEKALSGRILAIIFAGNHTDDNQLDDGRIQEMQVVHLGDRWLSPVEVHLTEQQDIKGQGTFLSNAVQGGDVDAVIQKWMNHFNMTKRFTIGGDPRFETHEGVSLSGTLVLRLEKDPAAPEIKELSVIIPYVYYDK